MSCGNQINRNIKRSCGGHIAYRATFAFIFLIFSILEKSFYHKSSLVISVKFSEVDFLSCWIRRLLIPFSSQFQLFKTQPLRVYIEFQVFEFVTTSSNLVAWLPRRFSSYYQPNLMKLEVIYYHLVPSSIYS